MRRARQLVTPSEDAVRGPQRDRGDRGGRVGGAGGDEHAAVGDEQVRHVMGQAVRVHDGGRGVRAHTRRSHEVTVRPVTDEVDVRSPGRLERFASSLRVPCHQPSRVVTEPVPKSGRGQARVVEHGGRELDAVVEVG